MNLLPLKQMATGLGYLVFSTLAYEFIIKSKNPGSGITSSSIINIISPEAKWDTADLEIQ